MTQSLGADLLSVVARINRLATQRARLPLPYAQARLLSTIEDQGAVRISDLAALDHCSQPTMTTQVRRLEDGGYVSRSVDPDDARAVLIRITPKGVETLRQVRVDRAAAVDPYLARLDATDRQALSEAVRVMRGLLEDAWFLAVGRGATGRAAHDGGVLVHGGVLDGEPAFDRGSRRPWLKPHR